MSESLGRVNELFEAIKTDRDFIVVEKHGGALRNSYTQHVPAALPDIVLSDTSAWSDMRPPHVFAADNYLQDHDMVIAREMALSESIEQANRRPNGPIIYSWFKSPRVEELARSTGAEALVSRDERACSIIEDKTLLYSHLRRAGCDVAMMPRHVSFESKHQLPGFESIQDTFKIPFVLQGISMGGDGTFIVSTEEEYAAGWNNLKGAVRLSEFVAAPYSSIYCASLPGIEDGTVNTYVDVPSYKPVNVSELGIGRVMGAGGDWRAPRENFDIEGVVTDIQKLAQYFYEELGYFGHFVVEGFHDNGRFLFNEINARPGGGSEVNSCYQYDRGVPSFALLHVLGRLGMIRSDIVDSGGYNHETIDCVRHGSDTGAIYLKYKDMHKRNVVPSQGYQGSGIYTLINGELVWQRMGNATRQADLDVAEFLIANGPKENGVTLANKQICTIEGIGQQSLLDKDLQLNELGRMLAGAAQRLFDIEMNVPNLQS